MDSYLQPQDELMAGVGGTQASYGPDLNESYYSTPAGPRLKPAGSGGGFGGGMSNPGGIGSMFSRFTPGNPDQYSNTYSDYQNPLSAIHKTNNFIQSGGMVSSGRGTVMPSTRNPGQGIF